MTSQDRLLAHQLNLEGLTLGEIGSKLGVTRQRVHQILQPPRSIFNAIMARTRGQCEHCGIRARPVHIHAHEVEREVNEYEGEGALTLLCLPCARRVHRKKGRGIR